MRPKSLAVIAAVLALTGSIFADLVFPASFQIIEKTPEQYEISLTLPLVKGRFAKARPLLPDAIKVEGEPTARAGTGSITRTWQAQIEPGALSGSAIGLDGLLGTTLEVRFLVSTLDGRRHETVLRPKRPFFVVPNPPHTGELAQLAVHEGVRQTLRMPGLWFLLAGLVGFGTAWRRWHLVIATSSVVLLSALLAGSTGMLSLSITGLSDAEARLATGFLMVGWILAGVVMAAILGLIESVLSARVLRRFHALTALVASTWVFYQTAGLVYHNGHGWLVALQRILDGFTYRWFTPFATDWAMARLRIPWISLTVVAVGGWILIRFARRRARLAGAVALLGLGVVLLPWGVSRATVPFLNPEAPAPSQARRILNPMLTQIYHALDLEDENQTYDRLSEQVSGDLITDLYLDSRRRLIAGTREGASVAVKDVTVLEVGPHYAGTAEASVFRYPCRWTVTAKVTHWQHSHERRNLYEGDLSLAVEEDRWKLAGIELHSEEREVVPGSFSSR
jgi:hypothetical protein